MQRSVISDIDATVHLLLRPNPAEFYLRITAANVEKLVTSYRQRMSSLQENIKTIFDRNKSTYRIFESVQELAIRG